VTGGWLCCEIAGVENRLSKQGAIPLMRYKRNHVSMDSEASSVSSPMASNTMSLSVLWHPPVETAMARLLRNHAHPPTL